MRKTNPKLALKIQGRSRGRPSSMHAVAHPQSLSPVGHEKRLPFHCASVWIPVPACTLRYRRTLAPVGWGQSGPRVASDPVKPSPFALGHGQDGPWHGMGQRLWVWWVSHSAASCSNRGTWQSTRSTRRDVFQVPATTHSAQSNPLSSTPTPTPTTHPHPHHPSSPLALLLQPQLHCTAATAAVTLGASLVPLSSPSQVVSSLGLPSLVLCFSIPRRTASGRQSLVFPSLPVLHLLLHTSSSSDIRLPPSFRLPSKTRRTSTLGCCLAC